MKKYTTLFENGQWYKGNTHTHSLTSDGNYPYNEVIGFYKNRGYNFLSMTKHDIYTGYQEFNNSNFIIIPGMEIAAMSPDGIYNGLLVLGKKELTELNYVNEQNIGPLVWAGKQGFQESINELSDNGNIVIVHCPYWNQMTPESLRAYSGYCAIEIYNQECQSWGRQGHAENYWDLLIKSGRKVWGIACDDLHYGGDSRFFGCAWVMVKSTGLSTSEITSAIEQGSFYSTQGPQIYDYYIQGDTLHLECSKVTKAYITGFGNFVDGNATCFCGMTCWENDEFFKNAGDNMSLMIKVSEIQHLDDVPALSLANYVVRVTLEDEQKNLAWANPIFVSK